MIRSLLDGVTTHISLEHTRQVHEALHRRDRWFDYEAFHQTADDVLDRLRALDIEAERHAYPADGQSLVGDWRMPLAWDATSARLSLIPSGEVIADYQQIPCSLSMWSAPTPPEGIRAPLVLLKEGIGNEEDGAPDVRGKVILTPVHPHRMKAQAAQQGALGIVSFFMHRADDALSDAVAWINAWSDAPDGWPQLATDSAIWGFNLSPREGRALAQRLEREEIWVHAQVSTRLYEGTLPVVTGRIPGSELPEEEILVLGHLFEQGALDNAFGGAVMLEVARLLQTLVRDGELPPLRRSVRFLFTHECYGTYAYLQERMGNLRDGPQSASDHQILAGLCLDSTGGEAYRGEDAPWIHLHLNPHAHPSYTDALILALAETVWPEAMWEPRPFAMTDNLVADPAIGIPCPWLAPVNRYWHTSADTLDKVDPSWYPPLIGVAASYVLLLANAGRETAHWLARQIVRRAETTFAWAHTDRLDRSGLDYLRDHVGDALDSVRRFGIASEVEALQMQLDERWPRRSASPRKGWKPRRRCLSTVTFDGLSREEREGRPSPRWSRRWMELLFWCDGRRSVDQIAECLRQSRRPFPYETRSPSLPLPPSDHEDLIPTFAFLKRHGYVD